jgi:hypothetical protein
MDQLKALHDAEGDEIMKIIMPTFDFPLEASETNS